MAYIKAPVPITGLHAGLSFVNGKAETESEWLMSWFREHGYTVEEQEAGLSAPARSKKSGRADA